MTEAERIRTIAHAAADSYAALDSFQRAKRDRYAANIIYYFLRAYERFTRTTYAGEIRIADLKNLLEHISEDGTYSVFDDEGAPNAFMRRSDRSERQQTTFAEYCAWAIAQSYYRRF